jgi:hypothetical protein
MYIHLTLSTYTHTRTHAQLDTPSIHTHTHSLTYLGEGPLTHQGEQLELLRRVFSLKGTRLQLHYLTHLLSRFRILIRSFAAFSSSTTSFPRVTVPLRSHAPHR